MLSLTCLILALTQSTADQPTSKSKLYMSDYFKTTYATDRALDYWNHGPIYLQELTNKQKQSIFPAYRSNIGLYNGKVTNGKLKEVESKTLSAKYNVYLGGVVGTLETPGDLRLATTTYTTTTATTTTTALNNIIPSLTAESKPAILETLPSTTKQINFTHLDYKVTSDDKSKPYPTSAIATQGEVSMPTIPVSEKVHVIHPEHKTTFDNKSRPTTTTKDITTNKAAATKNIDDTYTKQGAIFDEDPQPYPIPAIMTEGNMLTITVPVIINITRPEHDTPFDDYPKPYPLTTIIFVTETLSTTTPIAPTPEKRQVTQPEYETTFDDNPQPYPRSLITTLSPTITNDATVDYIPLSTKMMPSPAPESEKKIEYYDVGVKMSTMEKILTPKVYEPLIRAVDFASDPFSFFLHKLLIILSMKKVEDLPTLVNQFKEYTSMLLTNGTLGPMGYHINSYISQRILILDTYPLKSLSNFFTTIHKKMGNRQKEFAKDINDIIDYMDDTYDEAEEEAMQAVLREATLYPNSRNNDKIAQGFIDYVFLKPMLRILGTVRGNTLFEMITEALKKRYPYLAKYGKVPIMNFRKTLRQLRESATAKDRSNEEKYKRNKLYNAKKNEDNKRRDRSDDFIENHKITRSSRLNQHKGKEKRYESKSKKYKEFINYHNIRTRNTRQQYFSNIKKRTTRKNKMSRVTGKLSPRHSMRSMYLNRNDDDNFKQNSIMEERPSRTTSSNIGKETESSSVEMELEARIHETLRHMPLAKSSASVKDSYSYTTNQDSSYEDSKRILRNNIYKWVKKLFNKLSG